MGDIDHEGVWSTIGTDEIQCNRVSLSQGYGGTGIATVPTSYEASRQHDCPRCRVNVRNRSLNFGRSYVTESQEEYSKDHD